MFAEALGFHGFPTILKAVPCWPAPPPCNGLPRRAQENHCRVRQLSGSVCRHGHVLRLSAQTINSHAIHARNAMNEP